jgi:2-polyprenyl-6-hydroxyphenyl methylase/3-demethylubiquinone-9 3-methyltransferase
MTGRLAVEGGPLRRTGDDVAIEGGYQHRALHEGNAVQRFWHLNKQLTIARYLPPRPGTFVVDAGCGSGVVADFLARGGATVVGLDASPDAVAFARRTYARPNLSFEVALADEAFRFARPADAVYCLELLEHLYPEQAAQVLRAFRAGLAPGGRLYLTTPNAHSPWPVLEWLMDALRLAPHMAGDQHVAQYTRRSLRVLCESAGFVVERLDATLLLAPWLAPLGLGLARRVNELETGRGPGCILVCVARREGG